jgi:hypothetical protein
MEIRLTAMLGHAKFASEQCLGRCGPETNHNLGLEDFLQALQVPGSLTIPTDPAKIT